MGWLVNRFGLITGLHQDLPALLLLPVGGDRLLLVHTLLLGLVLAHLLGLLSGHLLHVVSAAGLGDRLAGGGGDVFALLLISLLLLVDTDLANGFVLDILALLVRDRATDLHISVGADILSDNGGYLPGYLVTLFPWNIPAFFPGNISAHLSRNITALFPGYILARLPGHGTAFISRNISAGLTGNLLACFPSNIFTHLPRDLLAALLRLIPTNLMRNSTFNHLRKIFALHLRNIPALLDILGVALPVHNVKAVLLGHVAALLGCHIPALNRVVELLADLLGGGMALLLSRGGALSRSHILAFIMGFLLADLLLHLLTLPR